MEKIRIYKFLIGLPFWWILLTSIYLMLTILGGGYVTGFLGLFVPIGFYSLILFFERAFGEGSIWVIIVFPLVLLTIFGGEWLIRKLNLSPARKIFIILGVLFVLTIAVDLILWGNWQSLKFLMEGGAFKGF